MTIKLIILKVNSLPFLVLEVYNSFTLLSKLKNFYFLEEKLKVHSIFHISSWMMFVS